MPVALTVVPLSNERLQEESLAQKKAAEKTGWSDDYVVIIPVTIHLSRFT